MKRRYLSTYFKMRELKLLIFTPVNKGSKTLHG